MTQPESVSRRGLLPRLSAAIGLALCLAGCATAAPRSLSIQEIRAFKFTALEVKLAPGATVSWPNLSDEYVEAKLAGQPNDPTEETFTKLAKVGLSRETVVADLRQMSEDRLTAAAKAALEGPLREQLAGTRPVIAVVTVEQIAVPSLVNVLLSGLAARISLGEEGAQSRLKVRISLVDARTRAVLLVYDPKFATSVPGGKPIIDIGATGIMSAKPEERLFFTLRGPFLQWLSAV